MRLVEKDMGAWLAERLGCPFTPPYTTFAIEDEFFTVRGAVLLNHWNGANVDITLYAPGCFRRGFIRDIFDYVFNRCGAERLSALTENTDVEYILERMGFEEEGLRKNYYGKGRHASCWRLDPEKAERFMT